MVVWLLLSFFNRAYYDGKGVSKSLLKSCCLDTLTEVFIVDKLRKLV